MIQVTSEFQQFARYLLNDLRRSPRTCGEYLKDLHDFVQWSAACATPLPVSYVSESIVQAYIAALSSRSLAASTIRRRVSSVRAFFRWLDLRDGTNANPARRVRTPRVPPRLVQPASEAAVLQYLSSQPAAPAARRVWCAVLLMYACGLRLSEVLSLHSDDFDFSRHVVRIIGKGNKERFAPFAPSVGQVLSQFVTASTWQLFPDARESTYRWAIINATRTNGRGIHPHQLRHLFACKCLEAGMPLKTLSLIMGHSNVKTTERYLNVNTQNLAQSAEKYAPSL